MYDAIVIGARVAGSSTAMLLARKGYKVLVVDRATFPSDTISSHQIQIPGIARLKHWGLLEKIIATNAPPTRHVHFDAGFTSFEGSYPTYAGLDAMFSPRRTVLDQILVDAARDAGAEVREAFTIDGILSENERVIGIHGHTRKGTEISENAKIVIGADGKHSMLAQAVKAPVYHEKPVMSCAYYSYFSGISTEGGELFTREKLSLGIWPTNDGMVIVFIAFPIGEFDRIRSNVEKYFLQAIDQVSPVAQRIRSGRREERIYGTADMPNFYRKPYGPGWALVGDAGYTKDAITGQGIGDAFRDAESLVEAIDAGFSGKKPPLAALAAHENERNQVTLPMYEFTAQIAAFNPPSLEQRILFDALHDRPEQASRFFGLMTGVVPVNEFFNPANLVRMVGLSGMAKMMLTRIGSSRRRPAAQRLSL